MIIQKDVEPTYTSMDGSGGIIVCCPVCKVCDRSISMTLDPHRSFASFDRDHSPALYWKNVTGIIASCGHEWQVSISIPAAINPISLITIEYEDTVRTNYHVYIKSRHWRTIADEAKALAGYRCRVCNRHANEVILDAHHRTYERLGDESQDDITVLCRDCHTLYEVDRTHKSRVLNIPTEEQSQ